MAGAWGQRTQGGRASRSERVRVCACACARVCERRNGPRFSEPAARPRQGAPRARATAPPAGAAPWRGAAGRLVSSRRHPPTPPPHTFMTETMGSVSSCRMPTTDITCLTGFDRVGTLMGGMNPFALAGRYGQAPAAGAHGGAASTLPSLARRGSRVAGRCQTPARTPAPRPGPSPCCAAARCSRAPAASCPRRRGSTRSTPGPPQTTRSRGWGARGGRPFGGGGVL